MCNLTHWQITPTAAEPQEQLQQCSAVQQQAVAVGAAVNISRGSRQQQQHSSRAGYSTAVLVEHRREYGLIGHTLRDFSPLLSPSGHNSLVERHHTEVVASVFQIDLSERDMEHAVHF